MTLVFGREEYGLTDEELAACDAVCSISTGRLQESLSLSHAASLVLGQLFQARVDALAAAAGVAPAALPHVPSSAALLADGVDTSAGIEH